MSAATTRMEIQPLGRARAAQAYPLARSALPDLTLENWIRYVAATASGKGGRARGVLTAETARGHIYGLLCYRVERDPRHRRCLAIDPFVAFEIGRRPAVTEALLQAVDELARQHRCGAVHIALPKDWAGGPTFRSELVKLFETHGHSVARIGLCKFIDGTDEAALRPPATSP